MPSIKLIITQILLCHAASWEWIHFHIKTRDIYLPIQIVWIKPEDIYLPSIPFLWLCLFLFLCPEGLKLTKITQYLIFWNVIEWPEVLGLSLNHTNSHLPGDSCDLRIHQVLRKADENCISFHISYLPVYTYVDLYS